jgi:hypothetical protein
MRKGSKKPPAPPAPKFGLSYRDDEYSGAGTKRVWNNSWAGDAFEFVGPIYFAELQAMCVRFGIPLNEADD